MAIGALIVAGSSIPPGMAEPTPTGTWIGPAAVIGVSLPQDQRSTIRVTLAARTASVLATGPTGASHDAPSARATCTSRYRFDVVRNGWRYYKQLPGGTVKGEGGLENGPCSTRPELRMRVRAAGAKLKAELGPQYRDVDRFFFRAYLVRA